MSRNINEDGLKRSTLKNYLEKASKSKKDRSKGVDRATDRLNPNQRWYVNSKEEVKESMNPISEAIMSITEGDLDAMRQHFNQALAQKAVEKLEEHKLTIASNYFGQE